MANQNAIHDSNNVPTLLGVDSSSGDTKRILTDSSGRLLISITGTLGPTNGGTGTNVQFTQGSVVFSGALGVYTQDNANFFWDNTNNRLGIGTAVPDATLHIVQPVITTGTPIAFEVNGGAHTGMTGSITDVNLDLSRTITYTNAPVFPSDLYTGFRITPAKLSSAGSGSFTGVGTHLQFVEGAVGSTAKAEFTIGCLVGNLDNAGVNAQQVYNLGFIMAGVGDGMSFGGNISRAGIRLTDVGGVSLGNQTATVTNLDGISISSFQVSASTNPVTISQAAMIYIESSISLSGTAAMASGEIPYAIFSDGDDSTNRFDGTVVIGGAKKAGDTSRGVLALSNTATAPSNSANLAQLYSADVSSSAVLALYQETAPVAGVAVASTHKVQVQINGTNYFLLLSNV